ncbi:MAG: hypothetical protein AB7S26_08675 [Sandaracinaceae bacterium]
MASREPKGSTAVDPAIVRDVLEHQLRDLLAFAEQVRRTITRP